MCTFGTRKNGGRAEAGDLEDRGRRGPGVDDDDMGRATLAPDEGRINQESLVKGVQAVAALVHSHYHRRTLLSTCHHSTGYCDGDSVQRTFFV